MTMEVDLLVLAFEIVIEIEIVTVTVIDQTDTPLHVIVTNGMVTGCWTFLFTLVLCVVLCLLLSGADHS